MFTDVAVGAQHTSGACVVVDVVVDVEVLVEVDVEVDVEVLVEVLVEVDVLVDVEVEVDVEVDVLVEVDVEVLLEVVVVVGGWMIVTSSVPNSQGPTVIVPSPLKVQSLQNKSFIFLRISLNELFV